MKKIVSYFSGLSIKKKWTMISALTIVFSFAIISIILYIAVYNWLLNEEKQTADRTTYDVQSFFINEGNRMTIQLLQKNTTLINNIVDREQTVRIYNYDDVEIIRINDAQKSIAEKPSLNEIKEGYSYETKQKKINVYVTYVPIQIGTFEGYIELIHPLERFTAMMQYLLTLLIILGVGGVVLAATLSSWIARIILKPIQQLRDSMVKVTEEGIEGQTIHAFINRPIVQDEIGDLIRMYNEMLRALNQSFTQQNQFVQDASHELRTPIQAIEGHLSLIERWGKNDPEVLQESITTSLAEIRKMKKLMEELLLLARQDPYVMSQEVNIELVIQDVIDDLRYIYPNTSIKALLNGELIKSNLSEQALHQILRNIIENALHYSEEGTDVIVTLSRDVSFAKIEVIDEGIGIDEKHLPHIFDRFYRVDHARYKQYDSNGLGLSITKMLSEKYGIKLYVESEVGKGTKFSILIPII